MQSASRDRQRNGPNNATWWPRDTIRHAQPTRHDQCDLISNHPVHATQTTPSPLRKLDTVIAARNREDDGVVFNSGGQCNVAD